MRLVPHFLPAFVLPIALALSGCAAPEGAGPATASSATRTQEEAPLTLLVSVDGLGANRLSKGLTPRLDAIAAQGVSGSMRPSFPSNTFPNHIALVTGLRPDHHGIVDQKMRDPTRPGVTFKNTDPFTNRDPFWWDQIDPIWLQAERAGIRTATMHWVASDVAIKGRRPSSWWPFDSATTSMQRVDMILDWARRPAETRPALMLLYFDVVDRAAHNLGYGSPEEAAAIREVDTQIGRLADELAAMGRRVNLVIVSDHGMARVEADHIRPLSDVIDPAIMESITEGPLLDIFPKSGMEAQVAAKLASPPPHLSCWPRDKLPARFKFGANRRAPPWLCMADVGYSFPETPRGIAKGEHGYDPDAPQVAAMFIANGPAFRPRTTLPRFDNVDVYSLLCRLLDIPPAPSDGSLQSLAPALRRP
ncbi:alkaline phosphatase family protein [Sphingobium sp. CR28]|uniref:alkaline phosphatase family protein n=1 Tax=Sphingobium sp. CR28 TaxID=3400272 RepID=UPI003FEF2E48